MPDLCVFAVFRCTDHGLQPVVSEAARCAKIKRGEDREAPLTSLCRQEFSWFFAVLQPPVHFVQKFAWHASRAWKNSLQAGKRKGKKRGVSVGNVESACPAKSPTDASLGCLWVHEAEGSVDRREYEAPGPTLGVDSWGGRWMTGARTEEEARSYGCKPAAAAGAIIALR